jgi:tetratricopeptide (TPR) repeat protein
LGQRDDQASLERRYELHTELIWHVWAMGTTRGQEQAEQAVVIARRLQDLQREAAALHDWARVYLAEHGDATGDDVYPTQEECQTGQRLHEAALQVREALLGPEHPDVAESLMEILGQGRFWWPMQPYVALAERAVAICERALGPEHERTCAALEKLALMLRLVSDYARSLAIYERLLAAYTRVFGPDDQNHTQNTISQLAWTQRALGNHAAAAALLRDQLARQRRALGEHDPSVLSLIAQLSDTLHQQGEAAAADAELAQTLALLETERGPDHPHTLAFLLQIAGSYQGRGDQAGARSIYERVVAGYQRMGVQGDMAFYVMTTLFTLRWQQGDHAGARELFAQLLANGLSPNNLLANLNALGALGDVGGEPSPANGDLLALYAQLLAAIEQQHGPDNPNAAAVLIAWAQRLMGEDDRAAAIPLLARALMIHPQALAAPDGALLWLLRSIDEALSEAGEYGAVRALYRQTYDACAPALGAAHPRVRDLQVRLGLLPDVEGEKRER